MQHTLTTASLIKCYEIKADLIAHGLNMVPPFPHNDFKYVIKSLYGYEKKAPDFIYPQELILIPDDAKGLSFYVTIRRNENSPWNCFFQDKTYILQNKEHVYEVAVPAKPPFYDVKIPCDGDEIVVSHYVQKMGQDVLTTVIFNSCELYSRNVQCAFCEIAENYEENKLVPQPKKRLSKIAASIDYALSVDPSLTTLMINSGNMSKSNDHTYVEIINLLNEVKKLGNQKRLSEIEILTIVMPPSNFELLSQLKSAGVTTIELALEFWKEDASRVFVPGKAAYGREKHFEILKYAVEQFGTGNVLCNLIYGVQSIPFHPPYLYHPEEEEKILLEGVDQLAAIQVILTNTIYHNSGRNKLGPIAINAEACAKYHRAYADKIKKSGILPQICWERNAAFGRLGHFPNSLNNEAFAVT